MSDFSWLIVHTDDGARDDDRERPRRAPNEKRRQPGPFLRGPVPMAWLDAAARLPGKALAVGIRIWFLVGIKRSNAVKINLSRLGFDRTSAARGLAALERARLVHVDRGRGRKAVVTVRLPASPTPRPSRDLVYRLALCASDRLTLGS